MSSSQTPRLGLALSGGGFRASFFHLGVFRRLAELDLLRYVTTISSVSGGSIVAAHFLLHLRLALKKQGRNCLTRDGYIALVERLTADFVEGTRKDLRNRLFSNPWTHFAAFALGRGYSRAMADLYSRHLYGKVTKALSDDHDGEPRGIPLHRAVVPLDDMTPLSPFADDDQWKWQFPSSGYPNQRHYAAKTLRDANEQAVVRIPALAMNATCLSTGGPFLFMFNEVGGPDVGFVRMDEVFMLLQYKCLLENVGTSDFPKARYASAEAAAISLGGDLEKRYPFLPDTAFKQDEGGFSPHTSDHLRLYIRAKEVRNTSPDAWTKPWRGSFNFNIVGILLHYCKWLTIDHLLDADIGTLRRAKVAAWYLLDRKNWNGSQPRCGMSRDEYVAQFCGALREIDAGLAAHVTALEPDSDMLHFILDWYYLRSADAIDWEAPLALSRLTLADAVAASANFPPLFTPFKIFNLFDRSRYATIALTDGGINDNQGIDWLLDDACSYIIASDAGGLVQPAPHPPESRLTMMNRIVDLLMGGLRDVQLRSVREAAATARLRGAAVFHMTSNPQEGASSEVPSFEAGYVARIRTDLDAFNDIEIHALMHQGYQLADRFASGMALGEDSPFRSTQPRVEPKSAWTLPECGQARRMLKGSARIVGRFMTVSPFVSMLLVTLLLIPFVRWGFRIGDVVDWLARFDLRYTPVYQYLHRLGTIQQIEHMLDGAGEWLKRRSVFSTLLVFWAVYVFAKVAVLISRPRGLRTYPLFEIWKSRARWSLRLFSRPANVMTLLSLLLFLYTKHLIWIAGFVPLWCLALAGMFSILRILSWLWRWMGKARTTWVEPMSQAQ